MPVKLHIKDRSELAAASAPHCWESLKSDFSGLAVRASVETAFQAFEGDRKKLGGGQLATVVDGSGFVVAQGRWKLSIRVTLLEVFVTPDTHGSWRELFAQRLHANFESLSSLSLFRDEWQD